MDRGVITALMRWWASKAMGSGAQLVHCHCWYCGKKAVWGAGKLCYDHAFPQQYATTPLVPCCLRCNSQKRALTPEEYRRFHPDGQFWFEQVGLGSSPLGSALREDLNGFRHLLAGYLLERSYGNGSGIPPYS